MMPLFIFHEIKGGNIKNGSITRQYDGGCNQQ
jgi:hypothetical protein